MFVKYLKGTFFWTRHRMCDIFKNRPENFAENSRSFLCLFSPPLSDHTVTTVIWELEIQTLFQIIGQHLKEKKSEATSTAKYCISLPLPSAHSAKYYSIFYQGEYISSGYSVCMWRGKKNIPIHFIFAFFSFFSFFFFSFFLFCVALSLYLRVLYLFIYFLTQNFAPFINSRRMRCRKRSTEYWIEQKGAYPFYALFV